MSSWTAEAVKVLIKPQASLTIHCNDLAWSVECVAYIPSIGGVIFGTVDAKSAGQTGWHTSSVKMMKLACNNLLSTCNVTHYAN